MTNVILTAWCKERLEASRQWLKHKEAELRFGESRDYRQLQAGVYLGGEFQGANMDDLRVDTSKLIHVHVRTLRCDIQTRGF
jgi:hypothetical protein